MDASLDDQKVTVKCDDSVTSDVLLESIKKWAAGNGDEGSGKQISACSEEQE